MSQELIKQEQEKIGSFIKVLRERKGLTQGDLGEILNTSQSAIARMESGNQNFTMEMLLKISEALDKPVITLAPNSLDFKIQGGVELKGEIETNTSKNGAMGLLCSAMLNKGITTLKGIPRIEEVYRIIEVMTSIGVNVEWIEEKTLRIQMPENLDLSNINGESASKTRTIIMFIGALAQREKRFSLPNSQGCKLGKRSSLAHIYGLEELGIKTEVTHTSFEIDASGMKPANIVMYESGDTALENILIASALIEGETTIKFCSSNYMVQDVCIFLQACGCKIDGIGSSTLKITGVKEINMDLTFYNSEDPIETMMFISAAIVTNSEITIKRCPIEFLELELYKLKKMGFNFELSDTYLSNNNFTKLVDLKTFKSNLIASEDKIYSRPFPGINIDNLPFFVPIAARCEGETLIHDWVYENRAIYYMELTRLGVNMKLADPHRLYIAGKCDFKPAQVVCPPALRPAMIILIGMLGAKGVSILRNVYSINRGYEDIVRRLNNIGAKIEVINEL
jgi:UDP-N-acetylglucosamine 1-carboxyvinyltransferase